MLRSVAAMNSQMAVIQTARQNHLLLSRSLELMQQFIQTLIPSPPPLTSFAKATRHFCQGNYFPRLIPNRNYLTGSV